MFQHPLTGSQQDRLRWHSLSKLSQCLTRCRMEISDPEFKSFSAAGNFRSALKKHIRMNCRQLL